MSPRVYSCQSSILGKVPNHTDQPIDVFALLEESKTLGIGDARNHIPSEVSEPVADVGRSTIDYYLVELFVQKSNAFVDIRFIVNTAAGRIEVLELFDFVGVFLLVP